MQLCYACSPTSGFHHASYDFGEGFCTFNGLMIAAIHAVAQGAKVGILDCDAHYGNGTDDILKLVPEYDIKHHTFGKHFPCGERADRHTFLEWLDDAIEDLQDRDVVLYQAGADADMGDPLGGQLDGIAIYLRDLRVTRLRNVAWNLAGGYKRDINGGISQVIGLHTATLEAFQ